MAQIDIDGVLSQYTLQNNLVLLRGTTFFTFRQIIKNTQYLETERVTVNDAVRLGHLLADGCHAFVVLGIAKKV